MARKSCDRCGKALAPEQWIYSRTTGKRYCPDLDACGKRAKRKKAK